jgi:hypothetical protein
MNFGINLSFCCQTLARAALIWFSVATPNPADPEPGTCLLLNSESVFGFPIGD